MRETLTKPGPRMASNRALTVAEVSTRHLSLRASAKKSDVETA